MNEINGFEDQRNLVGRILASPAFARSPRLSSLLTFVCQKVWEGDLSSLSEQQIGIQAFGRPDGYNPSEDNIVRSQARLLRQKLEAYFAQEGAEEPLLLSIPKGGYVPEFATRTSALEPPPPTVVNRRRWLVAAGAALATAAAGVTVALNLRRNPYPRASQFWRRLLGSSKPALIVPGDTALVLVQDLTLRKVHLSEYLSGDYRTKLTPPEGMTRETMLRIARRRYTGIIDVNVSARIAQRPEGKCLIRYARDLRFGEVKGSNLILLGAPHANPWVELYEKKMNFWLDLDLEKSNFTILNRKPLPGEQAVYETNQSDPRQPLWAVVSYLPNLESQGAQGEVLILAGASVAGTEAAAEFIFNDRELNEFFAKSPNGDISYFNLLIETIAVDGNSPSSRPIAWRFL